MTRLKIFRSVLLAVLLLEPGRTAEPSLRPYDKRTNNEFRQAPLVVVGLAANDEVIGGPVASPSDPKYPLQLHRVTVHVENILKGEAPGNTIIVYYFTFANLNEGWRFLIFPREPARKALWLRKDQGLYRMACDCQNCTVSIESGAHPGYRPRPGASLEQTLVDLSLTRGEGPVDTRRFIDEIARAVGHAGLDGYTIEKLRNLALTEPTDVKYAACRALWGYSHWKIGASLQGKARDAVSAAGCKCEGSGPSIVCR